MITVFFSFLINGFLLNLVLQPLAFVYAKYAGLDPLFLYKKAFALSVMIVGGVMLLGDTPLGEWLLRRREKCVQTQFADFQHLQALFVEVCQRAGADPGRYRLYLSLKKEKNALAAGKKTVVVTSGLMKLRDDRQIQGVLAHELGHHLLGHAVWLRFTYFSNLVGRSATETYVLAGKLTAWLSRVPLLGLLVVPLKWLLIFWLKLLNGFLLVPFTIGKLFGYRRNEYAADHFAAQLGYGEGLRDFLLYEVLPQEEQPGFFRRLFHTHPQSEKRILRLEKSLKA